VSIADRGGQARDLRRAYLHLGATLQDAIRSLNESALQIVLIVEDDGRLIGTITDGDIRRALLDGYGLSSTLDAVVQRRALVVSSTMSRDLVLQLMQANKVHQLPVVDDAGRVIALHRWDDMIVGATRENPMVIMAGGQGTRLKPHTDNCPKPLLPIGGKPMLEHIIQRASAEGFRKFSIAVHYLGHMIEEYFGHGDRWSVEIDYIREQTPLGTAGALSLLQPTPAHPMVVSNGDILTDVRYGELLDFHTRHGASATMAVRMHEWQHPFGVVRTEGVDIVDFEEKPVARTYVNAGIYVIDPSMLALLKRGEPCDMPVLFERVKQAGKRTIAYPMHEPWLDVGRPDDYREAAGAESSS
jgi:dTDP-glucose pyrophosphorylase/CBS domain-containing protein